MKELKDKILEALVSALPITALVYLMGLTPLFDLSSVEFITFTIGAVLLVLGILSSNSASSTLWSCYCPSLRDTGMVSGATGFLDFCSYMAASVSSAAFANSVDAVGWGGLILVWFLLMLFGVLVALSWKIKVTSKKETR